ncbi:lysozyme inhibitor LprI family protein [Acetobacter nitrogenifigens]|uniref:lysozyme inhibitor LprI family protein n=1 Tax=Acetobacter nitrogenifigens TaxID=285268 RepID=UPI000A00387E|nr:lysozyme inhibitor LprI family protein [Acetobacter nitrogenifigens]
MSGIRENMSVSMLASGIMMFLWSVSAWAINCSKASSSVEKKICENSDLMKKDKEISDNYQTLLKMSSSKIADALRAQQRRWVQGRDVQCRQNATATCLMPLYNNRLDELTAMLSSAGTQEDGLLDTLNPTILRGHWVVEPLQRKTRERDTSSEDEIEQLSKQHLPKAGDQITATPEGLCVGDNPCEAVSWSKSTVGSLIGAGRYEEDFHLRPEQDVYSGRVFGKWSLPIILVPESNGDMQAIAAICATGGEPCWNSFQPWRTKIK